MSDRREIDDRSRVTDPAPGHAPEPLARDEVHVWSASLLQPDDVVARLRTLLDDAERKRADRFSFEKGRRQFTVGRGLLRTLLGRYGGSQPEKIPLVYNGHGKPSLADVAAGVPHPLKFNISHSGEIVLLAFAIGRELGVDLETIRPDFAGDAIAARFFSPAEHATIRGLADEERTRAFFTCWTRKEAYIKARGKGLSIALDSFEVSLTPGSPAALLVTRDDPDDVGRWSLHELKPGPGYVGALAVAGPGCRIRFRTWPDVP